MAAAFYNKFTGTHDADSAGTGVEIPGETLSQRRARRGGTDLLAIMQKEEGIDLSNSPQTQLTEEMLDHYDRIISMAQKEHSPQWLLSSPKYEFWDVADPGGQSYDKTQVAKDEVKRLVENLVGGKL